MARTEALGDNWYAIHGAGDNGETAVFNDETKAGLNEHDEYIWLIPYSVIMQIAATEIRSAKISKIEQATDEKILGMEL